MTDKLREAAQQALEALRLNNDEWKALADSGDCGNWTAESQDHYKQTNAAIVALEAALATPVPHGCHVDVEDGIEPDGCVLDEGKPMNCIYAMRLRREGKDKTACKYWQPIEVKK